MQELYVNRLTAIAAISGALFLIIGTFLHPMEADPNVPLAAFTEYAADRNWVASHLMQLTGMALMVAALVLLSQRMAAGQAKVVAILGEIGAVVGLGSCRQIISRWLSGVVASSRRVASSKRSQNSSSRHLVARFGSPSAPLRATRSTS
jgi:hypothetical protein